MTVRGQRCRLLLRSVRGEQMAERAGKKSDRRGLLLFTTKTAVIPPAAVCVATTTVYHREQYRKGMQYLSTIEDIQI